MSRSFTYVCALPALIGLAACAGPARVADSPADLVFVNGGILTLLDGRVIDQVAELQP